MTRLIAIEFILLFVLQSTIYGQGYSFADSSLVEHPVFHPMESRTAKAWKDDLGAFGEGLVHIYLEKLDRFQDVYEIKNASNNGIDRIAIRRGADGKITDVRFIEVKTTNAKPILAMTKNGVQLSDRHIRAKLDECRRSDGGEMQKLVQEIEDFCVSKGKPLSYFAELWHFNPMSGKMFVFKADGKTEKAVLSINKTLQNIIKRSRSKTVRDYCVKHLALWDQITAANQASYLVDATSQSIPLRNTVSFKQLSNSLSKADTAVTSASKQILAVIGRNAGRIAIVLAVALDAKDLFDVEYAYRTGAISRRHRNIRFLSAVGGLTGAYGGASSGVMAGVWIGSFGGPWGIFAGSVIGGFAGGVAGYVGGSSLAQTGANTWYSNLDKSVQEKVDQIYLQSVIQ